MCENESLNICILGRQELESIGINSPSNAVVTPRLYINASEFW